MKHIISYSGGVGSYMAAKRVKERFGKEEMLLVFADTTIEDKDLYRFLKESSEKLDVELVTLRDGRNPWDVFRDKRYIGNSRTAHCSQELKQRPFHRYIKSLYSPDDCIIYLGIDWSESHRLKSAKRYWSPYTIAAPMCEAPFLTKQDMFDIVVADGMELPELYKRGFSHNNCGGFCVRAGLGHFKKFLEESPELYAWHEEQMEQLMKDIPTVKPFLKDRRNKTTKYITLKEFRERITGMEIDDNDVGGCGCFIDYGEEQDAGI